MSLLRRVTQMSDDLISVPMRCEPYVASKLPKCFKGAAHTSFTAMYPFYILFFAGIYSWATMRYDILNSKDMKIGLNIYLNIK